MEHEPRKEKFLQPSTEELEISKTELADAINNGELKAEIDAAIGYDPDLVV